MIYALIGKTCSGKSTAFQKLLDAGYETVISYTTRPKRPNETDGKEYIFITKSMFNSLNDKGFIVAPRVYNDWFYGMNSKSIDSEKKQVVIVDPKGYRDLVRDIGDHNVVGIYFDVPLEVRMLRGLNRKDNVNELLRRLHADEEDFVGLENEVDCVVDSTFKDETLKAVLKIIERGNQK